MTFFRNGGNQRKHISLIVRNKFSDRLKDRAVLVSIQKEISVVFAYQNALLFLVH